MSDGTTASVRERQVPPNLGASVVETTRTKRESTSLAFLQILVVNKPAGSGQPSGGNTILFLFGGLEDWGEVGSAVRG